MSISADSIVRELMDPGRKLPPTKIVVFTDIGRDIDDAVLLIILAWLHKIGVAKVSLVVTNVKPTKTRAQVAKFIFEEMDVLDIPVAYGTDGTDQEISLHEYELKQTSNPCGEILGGKEALVNTLTAMEENNEKCSIIVISSLRDLSLLINDHASLVENTVSSVFLQGAWEKDEETQTVNALIPDSKATNNWYDKTAMTKVHNWLRERTIPTYTSTKEAALKAPISHQVFSERAKTGHPVAKYIDYAFGEQEQKFYNDAARENPAERYREHQDKKWYVTRTSWPHEDKLPETFEEVRPFTRMILYDVVAGLICPLLKYDFIGQIYQPHIVSIRVADTVVEHGIIGRSIDGPKKEVLADIDSELLSSMIVKFLEKALALRADKLEKN
jgi:inosine-uridine nucleoside N-ribohydrolase